VSRSGTLTYEIIHQLSTHGMGQSTCVGIAATPHRHQLHSLPLRFEADPDTAAIVMIGEIGGTTSSKRRNS